MPKQPVKKKVTKKPVKKKEKMVTVSATGRKNASGGRNKTKKRGPKESARDYAKRLMTKVPRSVIDKENRAKVAKALKKKKK